MTHATADALPFRSIGIVGCGLIGCSIAAALKHGGFPGRVTGIGRRGANLDTALARGHVDAVEVDLSRGARACDLVVICTPVDRIVETARTMAATAPAGALLTDAGSVKEDVCDPLRKGLPEGVTFIGSHPIAGSDKQGCEHARRDLFVEHVCVLTPQPDTPRTQVDRLAQFWQSLGMTVVEMTAGEHDRALAQTSHLPHVVAAALAATLTEENAHLTAGGFQDTTRVAGGDPALWTSILMGNATHLATETRALCRRLEAFVSALESDDRTALMDLLRLGKSRRDAIPSRDGRVHGSEAE